MKKEFQKLPPALQKQILIRFGAGVLSLVLFIIAAVAYREFYVCVSFLLFGIVFGIAGAMLLIRTFQGRFVAVEGICNQVERTSIRRRPKAIYFPVDPHIVKVCLRHRLKNIAEGDGVIVYVADNMPVYQQDGCEVLNGYLAVEIRKGVNMHE